MGSIAATFWEHCGDKKGTSWRLRRQMGRLSATNREHSGLVVTFCLPFTWFSVCRRGVGWGSGGGGWRFPSLRNGMCVSRLRMSATKREHSPPSSVSLSATKRELSVFSLHPSALAATSLYMRPSVRASPASVAAPWRGRGHAAARMWLRRSEGVVAP